MVGFTISVARLEGRDGTVSESESGYVKTLDANFSSFFAVLSHYSLQPQYSVGYRTLA